MRITFFGAAREVTGSMHLIEINGKRVLLDCGLFQGRRADTYERNLHFPVDPATVDALVLSHAHIDHSGNIPNLCKNGFTGNIWCTSATRNLCTYMLMDSGHIQEQDVKYLNKHRARNGEPPVEPLYTQADARRSLEQFVSIGFHRPILVADGVEVTFFPAGHILGAASVQVDLRESATGKSWRLVFSGDIGRASSPILFPPERFASADIVIMESTYGDRLHRRRSDTITELGEIFQAAWHSGGNVLIPAFAVGRSQEILYWMAQHHDDWQLGRWRIYLDSPMAVKVIEVYRRHHQIFDREALADWHGPENPFRMPNLKLVSAVEESRALNEADGGAIIIAGSGMCNGGRIVHHLKHNLWKPQTHVVIAGYQAHGTLGRRLVEGAEHVQLFGERIRVKAKIHTIGGLSAHADQNGLSEWYGAIAGHPPVWLVHGEDGPRQALAERLQSQFGSTVQLARPGEVVNL
ncbi:MAG: MBL fold metallo-hydrolase [Xanthomonadales bacterium]|nr:MBL fold metallo-hydrolase [Xanthomonadales bacterium]